MIEERNTRNQKPQYSFQKVKILHLIEHPLLQINLFASMTMSKWIFKPPLNVCRSSPAAQIPSGATCEPSKPGSQIDFVAEEIPRSSFEEKRTFAAPCSARLMLNIIVPEPVAVRLLNASAWRALRCFSQQ